MENTTNSTLRVGIYARVSTAEKGQDPENQLRQLREYAGRLGWTLAGEYVDHVSGKSGDRPAFKRLLQDAAQRRFDVLLVWALDRLTRQGVLETFQYIRDLGRWGVQFESFTEPHFRTTGPAGELMLAVAAWIAQQERLRLADRTKAGLQRARAAGKRLGRPKVVFDRAEVLERRGRGETWRTIAAALGVSTGTARLVFAGVQKTSSAGAVFGTENVRVAAPR